MSRHDTPDIRSFAFVGHGDSGKTTMTEHILFKAKATTRVGEVSDGTTVTDFEPEEKTRKISVETGAVHLNWKGEEFYLLDAPGYPDFCGEAIGALNAVDTAVICINASTGIMVNTRRMWAAAGKIGLGRAILINKMDHENIDLDALLASIRETFGETPRLATMPVGAGAGLKGVVNVLDAEACPDAAVRAKALAWREKLVEAAVEIDDKLLERYLEGGGVTRDEIDRILHKAIAGGKIVPIFVASAKNDIGVEAFLDFVSSDFPAPAESRPRRGTLPGRTDPVSFAAASDAPFSAQVYKIISDPFVGKLAYFRVVSGALVTDTHAYNPRTGRTERIGKIFRMFGKDHHNMERLVAGDLGALSKVEDLKVSDTLCQADKPVVYPPIEVPVPMTSLAVEPKNRNDEAKLGTSMPKLVESDLTLHATRDRQTHELVVSGMTQLHLDVTFHKLKAKFGVEVTTRPPKIPYLESITSRGDAQYRHKKQSGGAGQFAEVWMRIYPLARGAGFEYKWAVTGGAVGHQFMPSIEKGVKSVLEHGAVAGYPVVDIGVEVYDGKEHPVDSKDIAFQVAGREAFKLCIAQAHPVLLEPVARIEVVVPAERMGDIMGDLSGRRGKISGSETQGRHAVITAQVPLSEIRNYASELRSITGGEGDFHLEFSHYDPAPSSVAHPIMEAYKASKAHEKPHEE